MKAILLSLVFCLTSSITTAATIIKNTIDSSGIGICAIICNPSAYGAENFSLATGATLNSFNIHLRGFQDPDFSGLQAEWAVTNSVSGKPAGTVLGVNDAAQSVTLVSAATYLATFDMGGFHFNPGDYWLTIKLTLPGYTTGQIYWAIAKDGDSLSAISIDNALSWTTPHSTLAPNGMAFEINGTPDPIAPVPLPAGILLLPGALAALALHRRTTRSRAA